MVFICFVFVDDYKMFFGVFIEWICNVVDDIVMVVVVLIWFELLMYLEFLVDVVLFDFDFKDNILVVFKIFIFKIIGVKVVLMSIYLELNVVCEVFVLGVFGYLVKSEDVGMIVEVICVVV